MKIIPIRGFLPAGLLCAMEKSHEEMSADELRKLANELVNNPEKVSVLDRDQVEQVRAHLNPYATRINAKKSYANISVINMQEAYMKKLLMTGLVGYIHKIADEYEPAEIEELQDEFNAASKELTGDALVALRKSHAERCDELRAIGRKYARDFLKYGFEYNPDKHLRADSETTLDPTRDRAAALQRARSLAGTHRSLEAKLAAADPNKTLEFMRSNLTYAYQKAADVQKIIECAIVNLTAGGDDALTNLRKNRADIAAMTRDLRAVAEPLSAAETLAAYERPPPADAFHHFARYVENNYEKLREITNVLYADKPDFEFGIIYYDSFGTLEAARDHRIQHAAEFRAEVFTVENGQTTLLGPFKQNRDQLDFYNKNTEVLKLMLSQVEADHKLGKDMMAKRIKTQKRKNIAEAGPDAPGLLQYSKTISSLQDLGTKRGLTIEEKEKLEQAVREKEIARLEKEIERRRADGAPDDEIRALVDKKEDLEVPDGAIQVNVFKPSADGKSLERSKLYTAAEEPLHMQEGSPFVDKYQ